jgi:hypothetical protein
VKYYEEEKMGKVRETLEFVMADWPGVTPKMMFGCPCYKAGGRLFAFLVTGGLVLPRLNPTDRADVTRRFKAIPFRAGPKSIPGWPQLPLSRPSGLKRYLSLVRSSYDEALAKPGNIAKASGVSSRAGKGKVGRRAKH